MRHVHNKNDSSWGSILKDDTEVVSTGLRECQVFPSHLVLCEANVLLFHLNVRPHRSHVMRVTRRCTPFTWRTRIHFSRKRRRHVTQRQQRGSSLVVSWYAMCGSTSASPLWNICAENENRPIVIYINMIICASSIICIINSAITKYSFTWI